MGVGRARLFQQTVIDGALLSIAAVILAVPVAMWASAVLTSIVNVGRGLPLEPSTPDAQIVALAALASAVCGILISLLAGQACDDARHGRRPAWSRRIAAHSRLVEVRADHAGRLVDDPRGRSGSLRHDAVESVCQRPADSRRIPFSSRDSPRTPAQRTPSAAAVFSDICRSSLATMPGANAAAYSMFYPAYLGFFDGLPTDTVTAGEALQSVRDHRPRVARLLRSLFDRDGCVGATSTWSRQRLRAEGRDRQRNAGAQTVGAGRHRWTSRAASRPAG